MPLLPAQPTPLYFCFLHQPKCLLRKPTVWHFPAKPGSPWGFGCLSEMCTSPIRLPKMWESHTRDHCSSIHICLHIHALHIHSPAGPCSWRGRYYTWSPQRSSAQEWKILWKPEGSNKAPQVPEGVWTSALAVVLASSVSVQCSATTSLQQSLHTWASRHPEDKNLSVKLSLEVGRCIFPDQCLQHLLNINL